MRKFTAAITLLTAFAAFAPLVARADVGTSIYQPNPTLTNVQASQPQGRAAHALQIQALRNDGALN